MYAVVLDFRVSMELYLPVLLWFSVCITSVYVTNDDVPRISPSTITVSNSPNSSYDLYKAYESAITLESEYVWSISAHNLAEYNRDPTPSTESGPMCITYIRSKNSDDWVELHRTDLVWKKKPFTDVEFAKSLALPQSLRGVYSIRFELRNVSFTEGVESVNFDHILGYVERDLEGLRRSSKKILPLEGGNRDDQKELGYLTIHSEKLFNNFDLVYFELSGTKLDYFDRREKLNPYIKIYKHTEDDEYVLIWRTRVIYDSIDPKWSQIGIPVKNLCNGDYERKLKFVCMDFVEEGNDNFVGEFKTTLNYLADHANRTFDLSNPNNEETGLGQINFRKFFVLKLRSFADYIKDGLRLQGTIAIDFADAIKSNSQRQPPADDKSDLHSHDDADDVPITDGRSGYEKALHSISGLIEDFDWDRKLLLLGYGLRNRGDDDSHNDEPKNEPKNWHDGEPKNVHDDESKNEPKNLHDDEPKNWHDGELKNIHGDEPKNEPKNLHDDESENLSVNERKNLHGDEPKTEPKSLHDDEPENLSVNEPKNWHDNEPENLDDSGPKNLHEDEPKNLYDSEPKNSHDDEPENDHSNSAECIGSQGVLEAYYKFLKTAQPSKSSFLAPIVRRFSQAAKMSARGDEYSILIILTGGLISDLEETKEALMEVSKLRAIVLIVGIGDLLFENIKKMLTDSKISAEDCGGNVHFIDFERFRSFDTDDVRLYLGRELFLFRRDPLKCF